LSCSWDKQGVCAARASPCAARRAGVFLCCSSGRPLVYRPLFCRHLLASPGLVSLSDTMRGIPRPEGEGVCRGDLAVSPAVSPAHGPVSPAVSLAHGPVSPAVSPAHGPSPLHTMHTRTSTLHTGRPPQESGRRLERRGTAACLRTRPSWSLRRLCMLHPRPASGHVCRVFASGHASTSWQAWLTPAGFAHC
jgi:hypothetical protein